MNRYKVPHHIRVFVKKELMDYKKNIRLLNDLSETSMVNSRGIEVVGKRLFVISQVFENLNEEDRFVAEIIFCQHYTQVGAEVAKGISKAMYYNAMNKVIFLVAKELELI